MNARCCALPPVEALLGTRPESSGAIECQGQDPVADQGVRVVGIVPQMFDPAGRRLQNIDSRIAGSDPDPPTRIQHQGAHRIARQGLRIGIAVPNDGEGVGIPVPARDPSILDRDPQIMVRIFDHLEDVVAGQAAAAGRQTRVADQLVTVVADESIFSREPHESLRVLQSRVNSALWQAIRGGEVLENERKRFRCCRGRDESQPPQKRGAQVGTAGCHYWLGTQETMEAGAVPGAP